MRYQRVKKLFGDLVQVEEIKESEYRDEDFHRRIDAKAESALDEISEMVMAAKKKLGLIRPEPSHAMDPFLQQAAFSQNQNLQQFALSNQFSQRQFAQQAASCNVFGGLFGGAALFGRL